MNREIFLHIKRYPCEWGPVILDKDLCDELLQHALDLGLSKPGPVSGRPSTDLKAPPDHPGWKDIFARLQQLGWTPYYGYVPPPLKTTHFQVRTVVTYDEADINAAELLRIGQWGEWPICGFERRNGQRWVGLSQGVGEDTGAGWDQTHGYVDGWGNYFVHPKVRDHFEKAELQLIYHPLEWDKPKAAKGAFWELDAPPPHTMPSCLTSISQDEAGMRFFEDVGNDPPELRYRRTEVMAMGSFDAAWTKEEIGVPGEPREGGHHLVVSQRFRSACLDYGLDHVDFIPVRLVD